MFNKNNIVWFILLGVIVLNLAAVLGFTLVVRFTTDKVIHKLEKEYSPSPYGPGLDPDRIDPDVYQPNKPVFEMRENAQPSTVKTIPMIDWRSGWETERTIP